MYGAKAGEMDETSAGLIEGDGRLDPHEVSENILPDLIESGLEVRFKLGCQATTIRPCRRQLEFPVQGKEF